MSSGDRCLLLGCRRSLFNRRRRLRSAEECFEEVRKIELRLVRKRQLSLNGSRSRGLRNYDRLGRSSRLTILSRATAEEELKKIRDSVEGGRLIDLSSLFSCSFNSPPLLFLLPPSQLLLYPHSWNVPLFNLFLLSSFPDHFLAISQSSLVFPPFPFLPDCFFDCCLTFESTLLSERGGSLSLSTLLLLASEEGLFDSRAFFIVGSVGGREEGVRG